MLQMLMMLLSLHAHLVSSLLSLLLLQVRRRIGWMIERQLLRHGVWRRCGEGRRGEGCRARRGVQAQTGAAAVRLAGRSGVLRSQRNHRQHARAIGVRRAPTGVLTEAALGATRGGRVSVAVLMLLMVLSVRMVMALHLTERLLLRLLLLLVRRSSIILLSVTLRLVG